eukprot:Anaeramoba_ignava/c18162_g1_i1.p1 GENE.c18162_g1_i1~~c18162_g1_i1.p1  ORF type:complete len:193 (-),score=75.80 c18162_g1_i1:105-683(-)
MSKPLRQPTKQINLKTAKSLMKKQTQTDQKKTDSKSKETNKEKGQNKSSFGKREFDRRSGTGRPKNEMKKSGEGKFNWGGNDYNKKYSKSGKYRKNENDSDKEEEEKNYVTFDEHMERLKNKSKNIKDDGKNNPVKLADDNKLEEDFANLVNLKNESTTKQKKTRFKKKQIKKEIKKEIKKRTNSFRNFNYY